MKPNIRQRSTLSAPEPEKGHKRKVSWDPSIPKDPPSWATSLETPLLQGPLVLLFALLLCLLCAVSMHFYMYLPHPLSQGRPNDFLAANSRKHMEDIVSLGIRHVGSEANEVLTPAMIIEKVNTIKALASSRVQIEISLQNVSGSFFLDFFGGMTHIYQNVTNIAVRLSRKSPPPSEHAFLINAHYDSALGSLAASDDAVSCGTMLEVLRCLSSEPHPLEADHSLIFLFNGAEETILQASHGFITKHPWANQIRAFLNLEAAGAGGREIVFQTGPDHPWLARLYANVVPHPHASVVAQELFQSGVIPSDTDFRIFRDHGGIPGIDTAYFINGYVYHTIYDAPAAIPDGSIQRAGENVIAILREVANSPLLGDQTEADRQGKLVFFDIMGLMMIVYPVSLGKVVNITMTIIILLTVWRGVGSGKKGDADKPTFMFVIKTLFVLVISWLAAIVMATIVGGLLSYVGRSMSWYAYPLFIVPLYAVPSVLVVGEVNVQWMKWNCGTPRVAMEKASFLSSQVITSFVLFLMTVTFDLSSAFIPLLLVGFPLLFRTLLLETLITPELRKGHDLLLYGLAYVLCCGMGCGLPLMLTVQLDMGLMQMFIPLTGRLGTLVPPDLLMGVVTAVLIALHSGFMLPVLIYSSSASFKRWSGLILLSVFGVALVLATLGLIPPYSVTDPAHPRPKRFFLTHTDKTFYNQDGSVNQTDSRVQVYAFDYLGVAPIVESTPELRNIQPYTCEGLYCSEPAYIPFKKMLPLTWSLPGPPLSHLDAGQLSLASVATNGNRKNFTLSAKFPKRGTMVIAVMNGHKMKAWSLESYVPKTTYCPGRYEKEGCYFIFMARGYGDGEFSFWIQTEGDSVATETLEISYASHNLDPPLSRTNRLQQIEKTLPDWVTCISWTSKYLRWIF